MNKLAALIAPLFLSACVSIADAGQLVDVNVTDRTTGQPLEIYRHQGRLYVAGIPGNRFAISLRNKNQRVMTVLSADGINVISGETAAPSQQGYVLSPWQSAEIAGWRKSTDDIAAFYFSNSVADSYAGRTDRPGNVGVLAVAIFRESVLPPVPAPSTPAAARSSVAAADSSAAESNTAGVMQSKDKSDASNLMAEKKIGTGHGERIYAPTQYTEFRRASDRPDEVVTIYYNTRANLLAQGVIPRPSRGLPNPFPGSFVPDPS